MNVVSGIAHQRSRRLVCPKRSLCSGTSTVAMWRVENSRATPTFKVVIWTCVYRLLFASATIVSTVVAIVMLVRGLRADTRARCTAYAVWCLLLAIIEG